MEIFQTRTRFGCAKIFSSAPEIEEETWRNCVPEDPADDRDDLDAKRKLKEHFRFRYVLLQNDQTGARAVQPIVQVRHDRTLRSPLLRSAVQQIRNISPGFLGRNVIITTCARPEGQRDLETWAQSTLREALKAYGRRAGTALLVLIAVPPQHRSTVALFVQDGLAAVPKIAEAVELGPYGVCAGKNVSTKEERVFAGEAGEKRSVSSRFPRITMEVRSDVAPMIEEIYPLYLQSFERSDFSSARLSREFFCEIGQRLAGRTRLFIWRLGERVIGFHLCVEENGSLDDLSFGIDYSTGLDRHLRFITWHDIIDWALDHRIETYFSGPWMGDRRYGLGVELAPLDFYVSATSRWLRPVFRTAVSHALSERHRHAQPSLHPSL